MLIACVFPTQKGNFNRVVYDKLCLGKLLGAVLFLMTSLSFSILVIIRLKLNLDYLTDRN